MPKLMLVEDDNNLREIYEARLQAEGYAIVSARDGEEALVVAKAEKPDLIISDVMMPKISGFEMLDILRNTDEMKGVKIIMLTALGQSDDQQRADRLGADRYLVKSQVTLEDIVKVAHELLQDQPAAETGGIPAAPEVPAATTPTPPPAPAPAPVTVTPVASAPVTPAVSSVITPTAPAPEPVAAPQPTPTPVVTTPPVPAPATPVAAPATVPATPAPAPAATAPAVTPTTPASPVPPAPAAVPAPAATATVTPPPAAEPVVATPAPVTAPVTPATEPEPAETTADPAATAAANDAQSTAQEEGAVEAQIEDFVAGASQEPTTPAETTPAEPVDEAETPETAETTETAATPAETPPVESPAPDPAPSEEATPAPATPLIKVQASTRSATQPGADSEVIKPEQASTAGTAAPTGPGSVPIAHKKVIAPIPTGEVEPKKDLSTLLALEEAKQAVAAPPEPPKAVVATDEAGAVSAPLATTPETSATTPDAPVDPSSIAL